MDGCQSGLLSFFAKEMLSKKQPQVQILYHPPFGTYILPSQVCHTMDALLYIPRNNHVLVQR